MTSLRAPAAQRRDIDPLELYASAIDTSDYVAALAPLIRGVVPGIGLDVGGGPRGARRSGALMHRHRTIADVMRGFAPSSRPHRIAFAAYLADRLGWPAHDLRRAELERHVVAQAGPDGAGARLDIARKSAVLFWGSR
ncbi:MAG: hypothetical protein ACXU9B_04925 [Reyranella sp.]